MFKKVFFIIAALITFSWASYGQSQSILSVNASTDSGCYFNLTHTVFLWGNVSGYTNSSSLNIYWGDGDSSLNNTLSTNGSFGYGHNYPNVGTYTIAVVLLEANVPVDTAYVNANAFCNGIGGVAYKRMDNNCSKDTSEPIIYVPLQIQVLKSGVPVDTVNFYGSYFTGIDSADVNSVFTLQLLDTPIGTTLVCPATPYTFTFDTLNPGYHFNYAFDCDPNYTSYDLSVTGWACYRTSVPSIMSIAARNAACAGQSATLTLHLSPKYSLYYSAISPTTINGNTITWQLTNLSNTNPQNFYLYLHSALPDSLMGDTAMSYVTITPTSGDIDTTNNSFPIVDSINSSFDPNGKSVIPLNKFDAGQALTYTIHFENTGTDTAFNIHILDTLSNNLDPATLKILSTSHPMTHQMFDAGGQKVVKFQFTNIMLPDTSTSENAEGFVVYQINAKANLPVGTVIHNGANIFFDANAPVPTNVTTNVIPTGEGIHTVNNSSRLKVVPNPAHDQLYIFGLKKIKNIAVFNILGQEMTIQSPKSGKNVIQIGHLPTGVYFLKVIGQDGIYSKKFIKE